MNTLVFLYNLHVFFDINLDSGFDLGIFLV